MSDGSIFIGFKGEREACHLTFTFLQVCLECLMNRLLCLIHLIRSCSKEANGAHIMNVRPSNLANTRLPIAV